MEDPERVRVRTRKKPIRRAHRKAAICLNQAYLGDKEVLGAIIAHEVAHLYMFHRGAHLLTLGSSHKLEEYETDVAMFVMGLGLLVLRAGAQNGGYLSYQQARLAHEEVMTLETAALDR